MKSTKNNKISITDFEPINTPLARQKKTLSNRSIILSLLLIASAVIISFLMLSRSVVFITTPADARIDVAEFTFSIGKNFLFLDGEYKLQVTRNGYYPLTKKINVTKEYPSEVRLELKPLPGNLIIQSNQSPVEVSLDKIKKGETPFEIKEIEKGSYELTFKKYGYFPKAEKIEINGYGETQVLEISLDSAWGNVLIESIPSGAKLSVDGNFRGITPITTEILETGSEILVEARGHKKFVKSIFSKANMSIEYETIVLELSDAVLNLTSNPSGANITIGDKYVGTTPLTLEVDANKNHVINLYLEGYLKDSKTIFLEPEQKESINVELIENVGEIYVNVSPKNALLSIDNRPVGTGSQMLKLPAKKHDLSVSQNGYETQILSINPRPKFSQTVSVSLMTMEEAYWSTRPEIVSSPIDNRLKLFKPNNATFFLGAPRREPGRRANEAEKLVQLKRPFYLAETETSNEDYRKWKSMHNSSSIRGISLDMNKQPVSNISWEDAALFCNWLSQQEGLPNFYEVVNGRIASMNWESNGYRLPTESEWAWVSKISESGSSRTFSWEGSIYPPPEVVGNFADESAIMLLPFTIANYNDGNAVSSNIGSFSPNEKGIFNLSDNVSEWVNDFYEIRVNKMEPLIDYRGPNSGNRHVIRGASWALGSRSELRLSFRQPGYDGQADVGFRIARYVDIPREKK